VSTHGSYRFRYSCFTSTWTMWQFRHLQKSRVQIEALNDMWSMLQRGLIRLWLL
jgi:hypothetical protein